MRVERINSTINYKFQKPVNNQRTNQISFESDRFERYPSRKTRKRYASIIRYHVDWGWANFGRSNTQYEVYYPLPRKLNILNGSEQHLRDVAQSLCMYSDNDIRHFTSFFYPLHLARKDKKSERAYKKIEPLVREERERLLDLMKIKERLEEKKEKFDIGGLESASLKMVTEEIDRISIKCKNAQDEYLKLREYDVRDDDPVDDTIIY